ncbi:MAG: AAA family ATPase [Oscillospiraceae bacterium]|nr:AAA family ATPase [Oscillospiraceae bacterium]
MTYKSEIKYNPQGPSHFQYGHQTSSTSHEESFDHEENVYVSDRFKREILIHIAKVIYADSKRVPIMLGISGAPGEGKTFQSKYVLSANDVEVFDFNISEFENVDAGLPLKKLEKLYRDAQNSFSSTSKISCVFVDDIDVALGSKSNYQYTVNFQHLEGGLMSFANYTEDNRPRIPIILTGNNFSLLHEPLIRHGRMRHFEWIPDDGEMEKMIIHYFPSFSVADCNKIMREMNSKCDDHKIPHRTISFYSSIKDALHDEELWSLISDKGLHLDKLSIIKIKSMLNSMTYSVEDAISTGIKLIESQLRQKRNHLQGVK